jgi:hypothetical protein
MHAARLDASIQSNGSMVPTSWCRASYAEGNAVSRAKLQALQAAPKLTEIQCGPLIAASEAGAGVYSGYPEGKKDLGERAPPMGVQGLM